MNDEKTYYKTCPFCHNNINVQELLPFGTKISFFADYVLDEKGKFSKGRCFASINNSVRKTKQKEEAPKFVKHQQKEIF